MGGGLRDRLADDEALREGVSSTMVVLLEGLDWAPAASGVLTKAAAAAPAKPCLDDFLDKVLGGDRRPTEGEGR